MKNLFNNQLKYLSFHINSIPKATKGRAFSYFSKLSIGNGILNSSKLTVEKLTTNSKSGIAAGSIGSTVSGLSHRRKIKKITEGDWKELWSRKFIKFIRLGLYTPDLLDKLLFVYLNEKKENLKSKYTFNNFLSSSQLISYNFNKNIKKVDLNSLYKFLKSFFKTLSSLISFPVLEIYPDKIKIRLFYYVVPSKNKQTLHKLLHRYIRSDEKLYKEIILRRNFKNIMEQFKMKLFIAKWKKDNNLISIPNPISFFKGLTVGQNLMHLNEESLLETSNFSSALLLSDLEELIPHLENFKSSNDEFNRSYEYNRSLDLLKLDFSKLSHQQNQFEGLSREINNLIQDKNSIITSVRGNFLEDYIKNNKPEVEELQSQSMSVISGSKNAKQPLLDLFLNPIAEETKKNQENLKNLKDRKVSTIVSLNRDKFKYLIFTLEKLFKKTIILDLVRLKYPYHESNILAQVLSLSCKTKDFRQIMRKLLYTATISDPTKIVRKKNFSIIPSYLSGIKVRLGGRLITQRVVPRFTVQSLQIGSLARGKVNFTDTSRITLKNKRGAFSFTVTTSHIFDK